MTTRTKLKYTAWGVATATVGSKSDTKYRFNGNAEDVEGLVYYRARSYVPRWGAMVSADVVTPSYLRPQSLNRYAYVENNPVSWIDPSGRTPVGIAANATAVGGAGLIGIPPEHQGQGYHSDILSDLFALAPSVLDAVLGNDPYLLPEESEVAGPETEEKWAIDDATEQGAVDPVFYADPFWTDFTYRYQVGEGADVVISIHDVEIDSADLEGVEPGASVTLQLFDLHLGANTILGDNRARVQADGSIRLEPGPFDFDHQEGGRPGRNALTAVGRLLYDPGTPFRVYVAGSSRGTRTPPPTAPTMPLVYGVTR